MDIVKRKIKRRRRKNRRSIYQRAWYAKRKAVGVCVRCGVKAADGLFFCEEHAAQRRVANSDPSKILRDAAKLTVEAYDDEAEQQYKISKAIKLLNRYLRRKVKP